MAVATQRDAGIRPLRDGGRSMPASPHRRGQVGEVWHPVEVVPFGLERLEPAVAPPVRRIERCRPSGESLRSPTGRTIVDFGRNIVGWTNITVSGQEGTEVVLRHAEVLENGELGTRPLRSAARRPTGTSSPVTARRTGNPRLPITGSVRRRRKLARPGIDLPVGDRGHRRPLGHDDRPVGSGPPTPVSATLHANVVASMRGNFVSIPTDCPQRDERLGWTGDIAVFAPTALFLYDATEFLQSWFRDVRLEQSPDGRIPLFVPEVPFPPGAALSTRSSPACELPSGAMRPRSSRPRCMTQPAIAGSSRAISS